MTPEAKQLLKDKPELCKDVVIAFRDSQGYANPHDEDFDESWEYFTGLHTAKDWEILSWVGGPKGERNSIHSVRRLSDNEVFTEDMDTNLGKIKGFQISKSNEMVVDVQMESGLTHVSLACITKRTPLFITEDGKPYYKGGELTAVDTNLMTVCNTATHYYGDCEWYKYFSTREAAEQWVEDHKPVISKVQLLEAGFSTHAIKAILDKNTYDPPYTHLVSKRKAN